MALNTPPPHSLQDVQMGNSFTQPWMDWFYRVQATAGTLSTVVVPAEFNSSRPANSDTITLTWAAQAANLVFAGPASGPSAAPSFRSLAIADLPKWIPVPNIVGLLDTCTVPIDTTLVLASYFTINGTLIAAGNIRIL